MRADTQYSLGHMAYQVMFYDKVGPELRVVRPLTMELQPYEQGTVVEPSLTLSADLAQQLMDSLWRDGIRPTGVNGAGEVDALKAHIKYAEGVTNRLFERGSR